MARVEKSGKGKRGEEGNRSVVPATFQIVVAPILLIFFITLHLPCLDTVLHDYNFFLV